MKRKEIFLTLTFILILSASTVVFAHPGHTGGHSPEEITTEDVSQALESGSSSASLGDDSYESISESTDSSGETPQQSQGTQSSYSQPSSYQTSSAQASNVKGSDSYAANPIEEVNGTAMNKTVNSTNKTTNTTNITSANAGGNWLIIGLIVVVILILAVGIYVKFR
ncbi:hypothetical protein [Methanobrevibacter sp.]|uniref:hypothetical protein n=1 Tax=Methanobrevibacter sp. TaxID=66852 RepID=UPI00397512DB